MPNDSSGETPNHEQIENSELWDAAESLQKGYSDFLEACVDYSLIRDAQTMHRVVDSGHIYASATAACLKVIQEDPETSSFQFIMESARILVSHDQRRVGDLNIILNKEVLKPLDDDLGDFDESLWNPEHRPEEEYKELLYVQIIDVVAEHITNDIKVFVRNVR